MKFVKVLSLILAGLLLAMCAVSCSGKKGQGTSTDNDTGEYTRAPVITINLKIKNGDKVVYEKDNYEFVAQDGDTSPIKILDWYCAIDAKTAIKFSTNSEGGISEIGDMKAGTNDDGRYMFTMQINGTVVDKKMSEYQVQDGDDLWIVFTKL